MLTIDEMKDTLQQALPPKRFKHSLGVYETALKMAEHYGMDKEKVAVAALLHDCGREVPTDKQVEKAEELGLGVDFVERRQPILLHAKMGAYYRPGNSGSHPPAQYRRAGYDGA